MANLDHVGLNRYIITTTDTGSMTLGPSTLDEFKNTLSSSFLGETLDDSRLLLGINLYRNGPYGYPTWKQLRVSENPLTKELVKNNQFSILDKPKIIETIVNDKTYVFQKRYGNVLLFDEPPVVSSYKPIILRIGNKKEVDGKFIDKKYDAVYSFSNDTAMFSNKEINNILNISQIPNETYDIVKSYYLDGGLSRRNTPFTSFENLIYRQRIYPPQKYTYKRYSRARTSFSFQWNDEISKRQVTNRSIDRTGTTSRIGVERSNKYVFNIMTASLWPLDVDPNWPNQQKDVSLIQLHGRYYSNLKSDEVVSGGGFSGSLYYNIVTNQTSSFGTLWNRNTQLANCNEKIGDPINIFGQRAATYNFFTHGALYARRHCLTNAYSRVNPAGPIGLRAIRNFESFYVPSGEAYWDVPEQSGKKPFYNSYEEYNEDMVKIAKDYSILPEYRMSLHVAKLLKSGSSAANDKLLSITGGNAQFPASNEEKFFKVYSSTDFMKDFELLVNDHEDFVKPSVLTLKCKAIKKFLPYNGFYPCQRTVELFQQFTASYEGSIETDLEALQDMVHYATGSGYVGQLSTSVGDPGRQSLYTPLFAPGILFNTIKSGVACDYPVIEGLPEIVTDDKGDNYIGNAFFDYRVPFEAIVSPQQSLRDRRFFNNEVHKNSFKPSSSCIWNGSGDKVYENMANNFFGEVPRFFLEGGGLKAIVSAKESSPNFGVVTKDKKYGMRVKMFRSMQGNVHSLTSSLSLHGPFTGSFTAPQDILTGSYFEDATVLQHHPQETLTMYSRASAFGPPCRGVSTITGPPSGKRRNPEFWCKRSYSQQTFGSSFGRNFPFTPPYYHGQAWADVVFTPTETRRYSLSEILSEANVTYYRFIHSGSYYDSCNTGSGPQSFFENRINSNAMQLSCSINLIMAGNLPQDFISRGGSTSLNDQADSRWIIQTKFETPILNFAKYHKGFDSDDGTPLGHADSVTLPQTPASNSVPIGMWHQYGDIPENDVGVFMQVSEIPNSFIENHLGETTTDRRSLIDITGFNTDPQRLGEIASSKTVHEAIVAVPFIEKSGRRYMFGLDKKFVSDAIAEEPRNVPNTIYSMVQNMKKYVFPPQIDFVNFPGKVSPFSMYIFEFSMTLQKQDLADIWQNVMPEFTSEFESQEVSITHPLLKGELLNKEFISKGLRWLVFKVKQRAESSYYNLSYRKTSPDDNLGQQFSTNVISPENIQSKIQFNWPYDYFSFVELAKIETEVNFSNIKQNLQTGEYQHVEVQPPPDYPVPGVNEADYPAPDTSSTLKDDAMSGKLAEDAATAEMVATVLPKGLPNDIVLGVEAFNVIASMQQATEINAQSEVMMENFQDDLFEFAMRLPVGTQMGREEINAFVQQQAQQAQQSGQSTNPIINTLGAGLAVSMAQRTTEGFQAANQASMASSFINAGLGVFGAQQAMTQNQVSQQQAQAQQAEVVDVEAPAASSMFTNAVFISAFNY